MVTINQYHQRMKFQSMAIFNNLAYFLGTRVWNTWKSLWPEKSILKHINLQDQWKPAIKFNHCGMKTLQCLAFGTTIWGMHWVPVFQSFSVLHKTGHYRGLAIIIKLLYMGQKFGIHDILGQIIESIYQVPYLLPSDFPYNFS